MSVSIRHSDPRYFLTPDPVKLAGGLNNQQHTLTLAAGRPAVFRAIRKAVSSHPKKAPPKPSAHCPKLGGSSSPSNSPPLADSSVKSGDVTPPEVTESKPDFYVGLSRLDSTLPATILDHKNADGSVNGDTQNTIDTQEARLSYLDSRNLRLATLRRKLSRYERRSMSLRPTQIPRGVMVVSD